MSWIDTIKRWVTRAPAKPADAEPATTQVHRPVTLPNGRVALVDERGNFVRWESPP